MATPTIKPIPPPTSIPLDMHVWSPPFAAPDP
jgi:hypothetical protein